MGAISKIALLAICAVFIISAALLTSSTVLAEPENIQTSSRNFIDDENSTYFTKLVSFKHGPTWAEMTYELRNPGPGTIVTNETNLDFFVYRWIGREVNFTSVSYVIIYWGLRNFSYETITGCGYYSEIINSTNVSFLNISSCNRSTETEERLTVIEKKPSERYAVPSGSSVNVTTKVSWKYNLGEMISIDLVPCLYSSNNLFCQTKYAWLNTSFDHRIQINFTEQLGEKRTPEAVYYRLVHNDANMANCAGIEVTNATDTGAIDKFNATIIDSNTCDIWFLTNITASYNGTAGYIYWGNNTPVTSRATKLSNLYLLYEDCSDGNLYDNSTGFNWSDFELSPTGFTCSSNKIDSTVHGGIWYNGGRFWNNVTYSAEILDEGNNGNGPFLFGWSNQTLPATNVDNDGFRRSFYVSLKEDSVISIGNYTNLSSYINNNSISFAKVSNVFYNVKLIKGESNNQNIYAHVNGSFFSEIQGNVAQFYNGTVQLRTYSGDGQFDNLSVYPNLYYRNIGAIVTSIQEDATITAPTLLSPVNGSILGVLPEFNWTNVTEATSYTIQISTDSGFSFLNYSKNVSINRDSNVSLPTGQINKYYWRVKAIGNTSNATSLVFTFNFSQWNVTFNITGSEEDHPPRNNVTIRDCTYSGFNQNDFDNLYGPFAFPNGTWTCTFNRSGYWIKNQMFNADSDKIVSVEMPQIGGITVQEHTWLEAIYNCIILKQCDLYNLLLEINQSAGYTWQHVKPTDTSVVLNEAFVSRNLSSISNITINYTIYIPIKPGYGLGDFLPVRIGFWFLNQTNGSCYSQGTLPSGVTVIEPYCNPLMVQTIGPMGSNISFRVDLRPNLTYGTYNVTRIVEIDPDNVWIGYGQEGIGDIKVSESNSNSESTILSFAAAERPEETNNEPKSLEGTYPMTGNFVVISTEAVLTIFVGVLILIIIALVIAVIYFYRKKKR